MNARRTLPLLRSISTNCCNVRKSELMFLCPSIWSCNRVAAPVFLVRNVIPIFNVGHVRHYAKDKPKKEGKKKIELREDILEEYFNVEKIKTEMQEVISDLQEQYIQNVSIRSAAGAVESIPLEFEGKEYTLQDLAQVNRRNPKVIVLNFSAFPQTISTALEAINNSGMNLNPQQDGTSVFIPVPKITREHREKLAKSATGLFTKYKKAVREVQIKYLKKLELREKISVEQSRRVEEQMVALADSYIAQMEKMKNEKLKELLGDE